MGKIDTGGIKKKALWLNSSFPFGPPFFVFIDSQRLVGKLKRTYVSRCAKRDKFPKFEDFL